MGLLDDLQKLQFLKPLSESINQISTGVLVNQLNAALEEEKAKQTLPVPSQEMTSNVLPKVTSDIIPDVMRELDSITGRIKSRSDVYGRFIPAIAMLNPQLASSIAQEQFKSEQTALAPVREKADLAEKFSLMKSREGIASEQARLKEEGLKIKHEQIHLQAETAKERQRSLTSYRNSLINLRGRSDRENILLDALNDRTRRQDEAIKQGDKLIQEAQERRGNVNNPIFLGDKEQERIAADSLEVKANQQYQRANVIADEFDNLSQRLFGQTLSPPQNENQLLNQQDFINEFQSQYGRQPSQSELNKAKGKYWQ